jgi:UDP-N-acetylglucosamine 2-epimerase (non-hydrolysing)
VIWPVHPGLLKHAEMAVKYVPNVELTEPVPYHDMVNLVRHAKLILTDSGGLQELGVAEGVPVLVLRQETERPEGIDAGGARLVGTDPKKIAGWAAWLLQNEDEWRMMANANNPYGDGYAAERIMMICKAHLEGRTVNERIANWVGAA